MQARLLAVGQVPPSAFEVHLVLPSVVMLFAPIFRTYRSFPQLDAGCELGHLQFLATFVAVEQLAQHHVTRRIHGAAANRALHHDCNPSVGVGPMNIFLIGSDSSNQIGQTFGGTSVVLVDHIWPGDVMDE